LKILTDLWSWQFSEWQFNSMYYAMGLNQIGSKQSDYIGRKSSLKIKENVEKELRKKAGCNSINYEAITKDKFYANSILTANSIPCIQNFALISGSFLIFPDGKEEGIKSILNFRDLFFIKSIVLEAGEGVFLCRIVNDSIEVDRKLYDLNSFLVLLGNNIWVVQKQYYSHETLRKINTSALNTTRIVTIFNGKEPEYLSGFQGFATNNATTDSWSHGSVYVGMDVEKESLIGCGLTSTSDKRQGLLTSHPDSGIIFEGYPIPYLKNAVDLCIKAHKLLYFNFIVGWDVAITNDGPLLVEVNEKPGMNVAQCLNGGLKKKITRYASQILNS